MNFSEWEPIYEAILADFGYDRAADEQARDMLAELLADDPLYDPSGLDLAGQTVAIAGGAGTLKRELATVRNADVVFAASQAADVLREADVTIDCMVTDLDKVPATARDLTKRGTPVAVHAHGDNLDSLRDFVPTFDSESIIPTTQAAPLDGLHNFGGFTDGDRAAFLADALGAEGLVFAGWQFDDPSVGPAKRQKLRWAKRLLYWLETRRDEQFAVLDGKPAGIDTGAFAGLE